MNQVAAEGPYKTMKGRYNQSLRNIQQLAGKTWVLEL